LKEKCKLHFRDPPLSRRTVNKAPESKTHKPLRRQSSLQHFLKRLYPSILGRGQEVKEGEGTDVSFTQGTLLKAGLGVAETFIDPFYRDLLGFVFILPRDLSGTSWSREVCEFTHWTMEKTPDGDGPYVFM
jgi:hypothetical protein